VVDASGSLIGMVSERDLHAFHARREALALDAAKEARAALDRPVSSVMVATPLFVSAGATIAEAARKLLDAHLTALPVVRDGVVVGVLSYVDLLRVLVASLGRS
jgi:CBS domain-containing protein